MTDKTIKFNYDPHNKQKEIHASCSNKSGNFWTVVCAGRQGGKSLCAKYQAIAWALTDPNCVIWYVCPTEGQARKCFRDIWLECSKKEIIKSKIQSKGDIHLEFNTGSKIEFKSAGSEDSLRGDSVWYMILDECAFIKQSTIEDIIIPTMGVTGKKILAISTPKGKNYFFELWMRSFSDNSKFIKDYKSFRFTSVDNPKANKELINSFKQSIPDPIFRQEFEAEWVDSAAVFSNITDAAIVVPGNVNTSRCYMGVDIALAAKGDYTVITVVNHKGEMVHMDRFRGVEAPELRQRIIDTYNLYKPIQTLIEQNNQGLPILQDLRGKIPNLEGFITTSDSKSEIINNLIAAFALKEIKIIKDKDLIAELEAFAFTFSPTGKIKFSAPSGFHDDCVMSLAIAWHSYNKSVKLGGYYVMGSNQDLSAYKQKSKLYNIIKDAHDDERVNGESDNEFIFFR